VTRFSFEVRDVSVQRGGRTLLTDFQLMVNPGEVVHLVGPNGCGKTSLMRVMAGLVAPSAGAILWCDEPLLSANLVFHQNMAWLGHHAGLKADLTLRENIQFDNALRRGHPKARLDEVLNGLGISHRADVLARGLSAGQRRRLALARVLLSDARLWLLDEPFTNLDSAGQAYVRDLIAQHAMAGGSCVFAAHQDIAIDDIELRRLEWAA